jgi:hypothetical protein
MSDELDATLARYRAIPESWTYRIVRSRHFSEKEPDTVVESGILGCSNARAKAEKLQAEYDRENPKLTTWTKDLFMVELEHK